MSDRHECDCGAVYSTAQSVIDCAKNFHGAPIPLNEVAKAALKLVEEGLGGDDGYFPSPGKIITDELRQALRSAGFEIVYQRRRHSHRGG